ncbi:HTTM domain-containing protein [Novosphingobium sp. FSY-8]|uniref:HTTM domain-containing protein n=1 Tax=Novosphingobium ovatum TaxID=1908523 RepID=A0ABW9XGS7_9SPHN|nr:HTTM domain-containing protein [Novosphingobium ovatum]
MGLEAASRLTTAMMAAAFFQQSLEHLRPAARRAERALFAPRLCLSALLLMVCVGGAFWGLTPQVLTALLVVNHLAILPFFNGPYNGGADRMGLLILVCVTAAYYLPRVADQELAFGYLGMQLVLCYFMSGWVKVVNPAWRSGRALRDVFLFSAYPVGGNLRGWANRPRLLWVMGWAVMGFELAFPLAFVWRPTLIAGLVVAGLFHAANACLFGLNRFFWIWICAYPAILWLQDRLF